MKDKDKITYSVDFKVGCPVCKEMIPVGYAGTIGHTQHQGKKKCRATCERKLKEKNKAKNKANIVRLLFDVGVKKIIDSDIATSSTTPLLGSIWPKSTPAYVEYKSRKRPN